MLVNANANAIDNVNAQDNAPDLSPITDSSGVIVRDGTRDDWPLLRAAFIRVYGKGERPHDYKDELGPRLRSPYGVAVPLSVLHMKLDMLLNSPEWKLIVACPSFAQSEIMGMLLYKTTIRNPRFRDIGWLTVKPQWQRKGIATALMKLANLEPSTSIMLNCAFWYPDICERVAPRLGYNMQFRPYIPDVALYSMVNDRSNSGDSNT